MSVAEPLDWRPELAGVAGLAPVGWFVAVVPGQLGAEML